MSQTGDPDLGAIVLSEHCELNDLLEQVREVISSPEGLARCRDLRDSFEAHFTLEESVYYPSVWRLRPGLEPQLRVIIAAHAPLIRRVDDAARLLEEARGEAATHCLDDLSRSFAEHEAAEEAILDTLEGV